MKLKVLGFAILFFVLAAMPASASVNDANEHSILVRAYMTGSVLKKEPGAFGRKLQFLHIISANSEPSKRVGASAVELVSVELVNNVSGEIIHRSLVVRSLGDDSDGDGFSDELESEIGTDPNLNDLQEVLTYLNKKTGDDVSENDLILYSDSIRFDELSKYIPAFSADQLKVDLDNHILIGGYRSERHGEGGQVLVFYGYGKAEGLGSDTIVIDQGPSPYRTQAKYIYLSGMDPSRYFSLTTLIEKNGVEQVDTRPLISTYVGIQIEQVFPDKSVRKSVSWWLLGRESRVIPYMKYRDLYEITDVVVDGVSMGPKHVPVIVHDVPGHVVKYFYKEKEEAEKVVLVSSQ